MPRLENSKRRFCGCCTCLTFLPDLWEAGLRRYCKHSRLCYRGMLAEHDPGYKDVFMTPDKADRARAFARRLAGAE